MAEQGVTHFIGVVESPFKGAKQCGCPDWPFHYVNAWPGYEGAQVFSDAMLESYRWQFRRVLAYFSEKGIQTFLHHYNHFAPHDWYVRQSELIEARCAGGMTVDEAMERRKGSDLARSLCANSAVYQDFMRATWKEFFERLPELDGLLITLGEANYCPCRKCSGGVPRRERWDHVLTPEFIDTMAGYSHLFTDSLKELGKQPMIRCYHGGGDRGLAPRVPKDATYLIKYSGFNAIDCGPDPICHFWLNEGLDVWFLHELSGAENCSGGTWINPEHAYKVVARGNEKPVGGHVAFHNPFWGVQGYAYPGMELNMEAAFSAFRGERYEESRWVSICEERLGPNGAVYLKAGQLLSVSVLNIDKVVSGCLDDGLCFMQLHHMHGRPRFPGVVGEPGIVGTEPHPWRSNLGPLRRIREYLEDQPWTEAIYTEAWKPGEGDPLAFWESCAAKAEEGLSLVEALEVDEEDPFRSEHEVMLTASRWVAQFARFWTHYIRARVYYWGANSRRTPIEVQRELANQCLDCLSEALEARVEQKSLYYDFPVHYMNYANPFSGSVTVESACEHFRAVLEDVGEEFEPLISGRYYQWPDGGTWTWPELIREKGQG